MRTTARTLKKGFKNNIDRNKYSGNKTPTRSFRKYFAKKQEGKEHRDIPENIPED